MKQYVFKIVIQTTDRYDYEELSDKLKEIEATADKNLALSKLDGVLDNQAVDITFIGVE